MDTAAVSAEVVADIVVAGTAAVGTEIARTVAADSDKPIEGSCAVEADIRSAAGNCSAAGSCYFAAGTAPAPWPAEVDSRMKSSSHRYAFPGTRVCVSGFLLCLPLGEAERSSSRLPAHGIDSRSAASKPAVV